MTRVKFLLFALVVLGLWFANLSFVAPALTTRAVEQATRQTSAVPAAVALKLADRRAELQRAARGLAGSPAALNAFKGGKLEAGRLAPLKTALAEALPEGLRSAAVVGLSGEGGGFWARGDEPVSSDATLLDLAKLSSAGAGGAVQQAFGASHLFFSVPLVALEKTELKTLGTLVVGAPLLPEGAAEAVAAELRLASLAISQDGKVVQSAGADKTAGAVEKALKLGQSGVVGRGTLMALGPVELPMGADAAGGQPPLSVGLHQAVGDFAIAASVSLTPFMQTLADYQKASLLALAGLLALSAAFLLLIGGGRPKEDADEAQPMKAPVMPAPATVRTRESEAAAPLPMADLPPPPEASPDDFQFGPPSAPPAKAGTGAAAPAPDLFSTSANTSTTPFDLPGPAAAAPANDFEAAFPPAPSFSPFDEPAPPPPPPPAPPPRAVPLPGPSSRPHPPEPKTRPMPAYAPVSPPPDLSDPFAMAAAQSAPAYGDGAGDYNPDATRVATIPQELLQASARNTKESPMMAGPRISMPLPSMPSVAMQTAVVSPDDQHFHEVFRDFVATRERCGEPADGLTYEKFSLKLKKNREQLMAKHACRTVRFQVYVKEGKAALKATPIKE
ncbi:MAG: MXAN_5187 family protein [Myxococcaceae bacterium]